MAKLEIDIEQTVRNLAEKALEHNYLGKSIRQWADEIAKRTEPKKVFYESDGYADGAPVYDIAICPACNYRFEDYESAWGEPFCPHCGQALDWNITEDEEGAKNENT